MATLIPTVGNIQEVLPRTGEAFTLEELKAIVGGYIEVLRVAPDSVMFLNEDGKRLQLPVNFRATTLMRAALQPGDEIVGDVIICTLTEAGEGSEPEEEV